MARRSGSSSSEPQTVHLQPTNADPLASLDLWKIQVELAGRSWLIPQLDAAQWLKVLLDADLDLEAIFPGFCGPQVIIEVNELLLAGQVSPEQLQEAILDAIEQASGRRWWITIGLCRTLRAQWDQVGGTLAANGVTPFGISLSYWLDGAYATILNLYLRNDDAKGAARFTQQLTTPPASVAQRELRSGDYADRNKAAFMAAMQRGRSGR